MPSVRAAVTALVAVTVLAACGGGSESPKSAGAEPLGDSSGGSVAQFADCADWKGGSREARYATIEEIRGQLTPQGSKTAASPLSDDRAYEVFENACAPEWADSLRLYKLYARVQGFEPLR